MDRDYFIQLAGGVPKVPRLHDYRARQRQQKYFWKFFSNSKWRKSVKAVYVDLSVDTLLRKQSYSIEHVVPKSYLRSYLRSKNGSAFSINSAIHNPFNYLPSHRRVNAYRSSLPFDVEGHEITKKMVVKKLNRSAVGMDEEGEWVIPERSRGSIARAVLYMAILYGIDRVGNDLIEKFIPWGLSQVPTNWEVAFNRWILKKYSITNPLIEKRYGIDPSSIYQDVELLESVYAYCGRN